MGMLGLSISFSYAASSDFCANTIKYYDNLKMCTPYTFSYPHPLMPTFTGKNIIVGKKGDKCDVVFLMPGDMKMSCRFSQETIALMTSEAKYKEARECSFTASSSDPVNERMDKECDFPEEPVQNPKPIKKNKQ
jgi:hypothetical protein